MAVALESRLGIETHLGRQALREGCVEANFGERSQLGVGYAQAITGRQLIVVEVDNMLEPLLIKIGAAQV